MPSADERYRDTLEATKRASVGQLLLKAARLLDEQAITRIRARSGQQQLRRAHTSLLPHVDLDGTRLTDLAARLGVSKQAAGQLVDEMVEMGVLERVDDPQDRRAKLIRFSRRGRRGLLEGLAVLGELESELAASLGERRLKDLHRTLLAVVAHLEQPAR
jgi:DNA-binding MarR family transcriptional regulator